MQHDGMYLSPYVESEPWGFESTLRFLNRGVLIITPDTRMPEEILDITQKVESLVGDGRSHRNPDGSYRDRALDIDIIDIDGMRLDTPRLTLPHPRAKERPFVEGPRQWLDSHYPDVSL